MKIKSCLKQVRDRLFLNATKNAVREVVRDEVDRLVAHIEEYKAIHTTKGGGVFCNPIHSNNGAENRRRLLHHRLLASPNTVQQKYGGTNIYVEDSDR